ncbi:MAG TPA: sulfatase/phosphatase domain-containing protein [Bryobacteraceae bacterium]|nr:sulfatase/phosphatase domain-containing protein [Bryobacteraceae bacterium]
MRAGRRAFLRALAAAALTRNAFEATSKPSVTLVVGDRCRAGRLHAPPGFAVFTRAYTVCPEPERCLQSILTGRYPHSRTDEQTPTVRTILDNAGIRCEVIDLSGQQTYSGSVAALESEAERVASRSDPNTILVITATRGAMLGAHDSDTDDTWFEEAARVPLLVRWPSRVRAGDLDLLCTSVDILPTILGLCGVGRPDDLQGHDLSPFLVGGSGNRPEYVYGEGGFGTEWEWRMLVRGLDKAVFDANGELEHLYNLGEDPAEDHDLAGNPDQERRRDELTALAADVRRRLGDHMDPSGLRRRR